MENGAANELAIRAHGPRQLGFRDHRIRAARFVLLWGIAGILSTTAPGVLVNPDHIMLYFLFLMAGSLLLLLAVAVQDHQPMAERAAARLEDWIRDLFLNEERA